MIKMSRFGLILGLGLLFFSGQACADESFPRVVGSIAIQNNGQVKSFDSFARETLSLITEKTRWENKSAVQTIFEALSAPDEAKKWRWIKISYSELRRTLGLDEDRNYFSYGELESSVPVLRSLVQSSQAKRDSDIRPSALEQKAEALFSKLIEVDHLTALETLKVMPPANGDDWLTAVESPFGKPFSKMLSLSREKQYAELAKRTAEWISSTELKTRGLYSRKIALEVFYYGLKPFQRAWMLYLAGFLLISVLNRSRRFVIAGIVLAMAALCFHTAGLALRVAILGRPPVSNMYESVIYMNWVLMTAASVFALVRKQSAPVSIGAFLSAIIMIYADLLPINPSLEVLVPVLRSNYWLTIHVMTIVASYGVLGLAMGFGHRHLILDFRKKFGKREEENSQKLIYRTIQIGTLLLGIGTTLGGVWANESWGRFWGWDPKETWALITFLGYLVVIHLNHFGLLSAFGVAVSSIIGFQLVLMTWYGVNFVLGRGLHSYGQGAGGLSWIVYYLLLETLFLIFIFVTRRTKGHR